MSINDILFDISSGELKKVIDSYLLLVIRIDTWSNANGQIQYLFETEVLFEDNRDCYINVNHIASNGSHVQSINVGNSHLIEVNEAHLIEIITFSIEQIIKYIIYEYYQ